MTMIVKMESDGVIHIPPEIREQMGVKEGDRLEVVFENGQTILKPKEIVSFETYMGAFPFDEDPIQWVRDLRDDEE